MGKKWLQIIEKTSVYLLLYLLPTQLAFHFWPSWAFVFGIRVDYLAPAVYLTDIFTLILFFINLRIYRRYSKYFFALLAFAAINIFFSTSPSVSAYKWLKIFEFVSLGIYFVNSKIEIRKIVNILFYSAIFFSLIGILQFILGRSIGGLLYFLGERSFTSQTPGVALVNIFDKVFLRTYSTFPHPNSLAGYLGVVLILFLNFRKRNIYETIGLLIITAGFILSFSLTAILGLLVILVFKYVFAGKKYFNKFLILIIYASFFISLTLPIFSKKIYTTGLGLSQNISQRLDFSYLSGKMVSEKFLVGEGLNSFIVNIPKFKGILSYSWVLQPVHNVPLLVLSETGIFGLLMLFILFYKLIKNTLESGTTRFTLVILFIVITWTLDHYWFTLQQNLLLVSILLGLSVRIKEWKTL